MAIMFLTSAEAAESVFNYSKSFSKSSIETLGKGVKDVHS